MKGVKLVVFDMDGTVLDTLDDLCNAINHTLLEFGYPAREKMELVHYLGNGSRWIWENIFGDDDALIDKIMPVYSEYYKEHCAIATKPYDGILALIANLRKQGIKTAVVSNKPDFAVQPLCRQYFPGLFDFACGERQGIRRKPQPDSVFECMEQLKTDKINTIYVGDSEVDVATARNAGIPCIAVNWGFRTVAELKEAGAERIVDSVEELEKAISN
ncbi:MAG: HAD family hydrolase [Acidaminococcaceae bacterium]|nr:HAD family hydrolase [Acidaminococcaceae bacterium]